MPAWLTIFLGWFLKRAEHASARFFSSSHPQQPGKPSLEFNTRQIFFYPKFHNEKEKQRPGKRGKSKLDSKHKNNFTLAESRQSGRAWTLPAKEHTGCSEGAPEGAGFYPAGALKKNSNQEIQIQEKYKSFHPPHNNNNNNKSLLFAHQT